MILRYYLRLFWAIAIFPVALSATSAPGPGESLARPKNNACPGPELLAAGLVTDSSALLTWTDVSDLYEVEIRETGIPLTGSATHVVAGAPPLSVDNLTPGVQYHFSVRSICGSDTSDWATTRVFATELNNKRPCPLDFELRDTSCNSGGQFFKIHVDDAPGNALGSNVQLRGVRLMIEHNDRSDLSVWLHAPDNTRVQLIAGLNAGDKNIGDPVGTPCAQHIEIIGESGALPLSAAAEQDNITGYYLPVESLGIFANGQNPNGIWRLEICDGAVGNTGKLRVAGLVFAPFPCPPVENVTVNNVTESSASIGWTQGADSVVVEYGPAGFVPGNAGSAGIGGTLILLQEPVALPIVLNNLTTLTEYAVYVRRQCAAGTWGPNSFSATFFTNCAPTLSETFDALNTCAAGCADPCPLPGLWQNAPDDDFEWKVWTGAGLTHPVAGPASGSGGNGHYLYFRNACSPNGANGKTAALRTQCIDVSAPANAGCHFSFNLYMNTQSGLMSSLALQASTDAGQTWATLQTWNSNRGKLWRREYIDLGAYNGQTTVFQFVVTGVFGAYGDIALDNLLFYGSALSAAPDYDYYRDADGDGIGDGVQKVTLCSPNAPVGFVSVDGDCDDTNPNVFPGAPEILCNQTDENCNGMSDDAFIAAPSGTGSTVCAGQNATLSANGTATGQFYWFENTTGGTPVAEGAILLLNHVTAGKTYFLQDSLPGASCASVRVPVSLTVNPTPGLLPVTAPALCKGASINLALYMSDTAQAGGAYTWYFAQPLTPSNRLSSTFIVPPATTTYYAVNKTVPGCADTATLTVIVHPLPVVQIAQGDSVTVCLGKSVMLTANGSGVMPFAYAWSNGLNLQTIPVQAGAAGTTSNLNVTITDGNGCHAQDLIKVRTLNNVTQTGIVSVQNPTTCGGTDGSITLQPMNGTPPYMFSWSGASSGTLSGITGSGTISGLKQGGYRVTVTDASGGGCSMVMPQIVLNAPGLSVSVENLQHIDCPGQNNGSITLSVSGSSPVIQWSNNATTPEIDNLSPGVYAVTITDGACVQTLSNLEISAPPPVQILLNEQENVDCHGAASGAIDLAVFGATPPYTFVWSNNAFSEDIQNLAPGNYSLMLTDNNNCVFQSDTFVITEPAPLLVSAAAVQNVSCFGGNNGSVELGITGGVSPYQIKWNNNAKTVILSQLPAGGYSATVTDANGCSKTVAVNITQPATFLADKIFKTDPSCIGAEDGRIEVTASGGVQPYHFNWSTGQAGTGLNILEDQAAGAYNLTATDANGCSFTQNNIVLAAPQLLTLNLNDLVPAACFGEASGRIAVVVTGTEGNVNVTWNGITGGFTLADIPAGQYIVRVRDERGCTIRDTFFVTQPEGALIASLSQQQNVSCAGEPGGSIAVTTYGGTSPYGFAWSTGAETEDLPAVFAGTYTLTVIDANGCTDVLGPLMVTEPPVLNVAPAIHDIPCFGPQAGSIELAVSGGIQPYHFEWNTGILTQNLYVTDTGTYAVTVFDASGCVKVLTGLQVIDRGEQFLARVSGYQPVTCHGAANGKIIVQVLNGTAPYQFAWSPPVGLHPDVSGTSDQATGLSGGSYNVTVTDATGCVAVSEAVFLEEAPEIILGIVSVSNIACKGDSTGAIVTNLSGGLPPFDLLWSNGAAETELGSLPAGVYTLTATDLLGCQVVSPEIVVSEPATGIDVQLLVLEQDKCGDGGGSISVQALGGVPPHQFFWNNNQGGSAISGLAAGQYRVTVTDLKGCTVASPLYEIEALSTPLQLVPTTSDVLCHGDHTGAIGIAASGGTPTYNYFWTVPQTGSQITGLGAGQYTLTLTDMLGCFKIATFMVNEPPLLSADWSADSSASGWAVTLDAAGGVGPYDIQWDAATGNQTGPVASGLGSGYYGVTITDANDCQLSLEIPVGTVATQHPDQIVALQLAPNPARSRTSLMLRLAEPAALEVRVFDLAGQMVYLKKIAARNTTHVCDIELEALPAGLYPLEIRLENGVRKTLYIAKAGN